MTLNEAIEASKRKRNAFSCDTHILRDENSEYFTVLDFNLDVTLNNPKQTDKKIYYTSWNLIK